VLDQFSAGERAARVTSITGPRGGDLYLDELLPHFVKPVAHGAIKDVLLVLATTATKGLPGWVESLNVAPAEVQLDRLPSEQFSHLAEEYFQERGIQTLLTARQLDPDLWRSNVTQYAELLTKAKRTWSPSQLVGLYSLIAQTLP